MDGENHNDGFRVLVPVASCGHSWQAAYGLELMRLNAEADKITELTGKFYQPHYPTEEEFRDARKIFNRRVLARKGQITTIRVRYVEAVIHGHKKA